MKQQQQEQQLDQLVTEPQTRRLLATSKELGVLNSKTTQFVVPSNHNFKSAQWTPDGTCIVTNSSDNKLRTFVIPPDLLDERPQPLDLDPYSSVKSAEPIDAVALYPYFDLQTPATNLILSATNEHPIRLNSTLTTELLGSYSLVNHSTEAFIKANSLLFCLNGSEFYAGSDSLISKFDLSRPGQNPISVLKTGPKKNSTTTNLSTAMRGRVAALAVDEKHHVLAAGTFTRHVGLYDAGGQGACLGVFCVEDTDADKAIGGSGITQVVWSPCGRYLYIAERNSDGVMFYDIRNSGQLLGWLNGRNAFTNQRMSVDYFSLDGIVDHEIWAGGIDGFVRSWKNSHHTQGASAPHQEFHVHQDVANSVNLHRSGGVIATASGQRHFDGGQSESLLKLWSI